MVGGIAVSARRERIYSLDAARGLLAIAVMVYHLGIFEWDKRWSSLGSYSVYGFFVLSGFAMTWVYSHHDSDRFPAASFGIARIARILPLWWLAVIGTAVGQYPESVGWSAFVQDMTLASAFTPSDSIPLGGWSIEIEIVFYAVFPFLLALTRSDRWLVGSFVAAFAFRLFYVDAIWPDSAQRPPSVAYFTIPAFLVFFIAGIGIARLRERFKPSHPGLLAAVGALTLTAVLLCVWLDLRTLFLGVTGAGFTAATIAGIGLLAFAPTPKSNAARSVSAWLGNISYGAYLLHPLVYRGVRKAGLPPAATLAAVLVVTLAAAWAVHRWFEVPAGRWIRSLRKTPALTAA